MAPETAHPTSSLPGHNSEHSRRRWYALLILSLSLMLVIMDGTIVNVAIPSIVRNFDASFRDAEWVNTIYSLVYAATLILWGKIGDQYGRRLLFLIGVALFGLGSALVGAASSINMLIAMRALQGIGAGILSPSTLSIVTTTFRGRERGIAFGIWGATAARGGGAGAAARRLRSTTPPGSSMPTARGAGHSTSTSRSWSSPLSAVCGLSANRATSTRGTTSTSWAPCSAAGAGRRRVRSSRARRTVGGSPMTCSACWVGNGRRRASPSCRCRSWWARSCWRSSPGTSGGWSARAASLCSSSACCASAASATA